MKSLIKPFLNGVLTGLFLQLAVGPIFFYILGITLESHFLNSMAAILAVTLVDYLFIVFSLFGIGKFLQYDTLKKTFSVASAIILVLFGVMLLSKGVTALDNIHPHIPSMTPIKSFASCFFLTISSPMTMIFWGSIFSAKAIGKNYRKEQLILFGLGAGLATFLFFTTTMVIFSFVKSNLPDIIVNISNSIVGLLLIYYGILRLKEFILNTKKEPTRPTTSQP